MDRVIKKGLKRLGYSNTSIINGRNGAFILARDNRSGKRVKIYVDDLIDLMLERKMI